MRASARELLVPFLTPLVWRDRGANPRSTAPEADALTTRLSGPVYQRHAKRHNNFHLSRLRKILKGRCQDKIPDTEVLKKKKMQSVHTLLKFAQLRLNDNATIIPDKRQPRKVLY